VGGVSSLKGGSAVIKQALQLDIPASALVDFQGKPLSTEVQVALTYVDPVDSDDLESAPGDFQSVENDQTAAQLKSFGMAEVFIDDGTGRPANLAPGSTATLSFAVPADEQGNWPESTGLYSFNEELNRWVEEGRAYLNQDGTRYVAEVGHFSYWNCDDPIDPTHITVEVEDAQGRPVRNALVTSAGVTYNGVTTQATDSYGRITFTVEQAAVERISAVYQDEALGSKEVDTPTVYVTPYEAPLVATFTIPYSLSGIQLDAITEDGAKVPRAVFTVFDSTAGGVQAIQADAVGTAYLDVRTGDQLQIKATYLGSESAMQMITVPPQNPVVTCQIIGADLPPVARFKISKAGLFAPTTVSLDASTASASTPIVSYHWEVTGIAGSEFFNEVTDNPLVMLPEITEPGHYVIALAITTSGGLVDTQTGYFCVY
jgi:hypothetical protein